MEKALIAHTKKPVIIVKGMIGKYKKRLTAANRAYGKTLAVKQKLERKLATLASNADEAQRWVSMAESAVEEAKQQSKTPRKKDGLTRKFKAAVAKIPEVDGPYGAAYVKKVEKQAAAKAKVRELAMALVDADPKNRDYWRRQYDRYS
jgi:hypothetical protein